MWEHTFTYPLDSTKSRKIIAYCQEKGLSFFQRWLSWCSSWKGDVLQELCWVPRAGVQLRFFQLAGNPSAMQGWRSRLHLLPASCSHAFPTWSDNSSASQKKEYRVCGYLTACSDPRRRNSLECYAPCCLAVIFSPHGVLYPIISYLSAYGTQTTPLFHHRCYMLLC